jgi:uncharacterized membrane protein YdfJ with MMPL/SSD domain
MAVGVTVDAIIVRSLLVPGLVALFGGAGMWPGRAGGARTRPRLPPRTRERVP